jgi:hypothetical protein
VVEDANPHRCRRWRVRERRELRAPAAREWSERGERRGGGNELGLGFGGTVEHGARLYIGGEGRPGSTVMREGQPGSNGYRACPMPAIGAGRARVVFTCWDSGPTRARGRELRRGAGRGRHGQKMAAVAALAGCSISPHAMSWRDLWESGRREDEAVREIIWGWAGSVSFSVGGFPASCQQIGLVSTPRCQCGGCLAPRARRPNHTRSPPLSPTTRSPKLPVGQPPAPPRHSPLYALACWSDSQSPPPHSPRPSRAPTRTP